MKIRDNVAKFKWYEPEQREVPILESLKPATSKVGKMIMELASKSCKLDVVSTKVIKGGLPYVVNTITLIANHSLRTGSFPQVWKSTILKLR